MPFDWRVFAQGIGDTTRMLQGHFMNQAQMQEEQKVWEKRKAEEDKVWRNRQLLEESSRRREKEWQHDQWMKDQDLVLKHNKDLADYKQKLDAEAELFSNSPGLAELMMRSKDPNASVIDKTTAATALILSKKLGNLEPLSDEDFGLLSQLPPDAQMAFTHRHSAVKQYKDQIDLKKKEIEAQLGWAKVREEYYDARTEKTKSDIGGEGRKTVKELDEKIFTLTKELNAKKADKNYIKYKKAKEMGWLKGDAGAYAESILDAKENEIADIESRLGVLEARKEKLEGATPSAGSSKGMASYKLVEKQGAKEKIVTKDGRELEFEVGKVYTFGDIRAKYLGNGEFEEYIEPEL